MSGWHDKRDRVRAAHVRRVAVVLLVAIVSTYSWLAFKEESSFRSFAFMPNAVAVFVDHHFYARNVVAFGLLGAIAYASVWGFKLRSMILMLMACMVAPLAKDTAQMLTVTTRHFDWTATGSGVLGVILGWGSAWALLRRLRDET